MTDDNYHVYPLGPVDDWYHDRIVPVMDAPEEECWLCQEGICTQIQHPELENVIMHGIIRGNVQ